MYRLLIVEDEKWEREGLCDFLDWRSLGIDVAGCARNGAEGMEMAKLHRPEIIITDIMMPKMDGIQMSKNIHSLFPDTKIIILSGYDDFQFAKQSFSFHAFSYILKPVAKSALEEVICRVLKVLEQEEDRRRERESLKNEWTNIVNKNRDSLLLGLLEGRIKIMNSYEPVPIGRSGTHGKKVAAIMFLSYDSPGYNAEGLKTDCMNHPADPSNGQELDYVINQLGNILDTRGIAFSCSKPYKEAVLYMDAPDAKSELESELKGLMDEIRNKLDVDSIISVGNIVESFEDAPISYIQAKEAGGYRFLAEFGELLFYSRVVGAVSHSSDESAGWNDSNDKAVSHSNDESAGWNDSYDKAGRHTSNESSKLILETQRIISEIIHSMQKSDMEEITLLVNDFLHVIRQNPSMGKMLLSSFFTAIANETNISEADDTDITAFGSISQTRRYLLDFLRRNAPYGSGGRNSNEIEVVKKVIEIIEERYADELNLRQLSGEIHLTPYYIGSIFKKHTGKQFNQYLNDYRIQKAKELLHSGKVRVGRLAKAVGIKNPSYFSLLFKSRFGVSPDNYREIVKGGKEYV